MAFLRAEPREAVARVRTVFERPVAPASPSRHAGPGERSRATSWFRRTSRHYSATSLAWGPSAPCTRLSRSPWGHRHPSSAPAAAAAGALLLSRRSSEPGLSSERPTWFRQVGWVAPGEKNRDHFPPQARTLLTPPRRARHKAPIGRGETGGAAGPLGALQLAWARHHST